MDAVDFVKNRRNRALATILSYKENSVDDFLPTDRSREELRRVILSNFNDFADLVIDVLKSQSERTLYTEYNELYLDALKRIEGKIDEL